MSVTASTYLVLGVPLLLALAGLRLHNRLVRARERTREAWSGIDVQVKRRAELVPNLVAAVRGHAAHERTVLRETSAARSRLAGASGPAATAEADAEMSRALGRLLAVAEAYPELRASRSFLHLQDELSDIEEKIAYARQFYNRNVAAFNARIGSFPGVVVARARGFGSFEFFDAEAGEEGIPGLGAAGVAGASPVGGG